MGSLQSFMGMLPSIGPFSGMQKAADKVDEKQLTRVEAIIDLRLPQALDALDALAADPAAAAVARVGFVDHEKVDVMEAARAHGCGRVLTKGQFAKELPGLLAAPR